jgi:D-tagatose-1,6-bisphosphate aldolase subunit GatZ/KbaZ
MMNGAAYFENMRKERRAGSPKGIASVCSANAFVIEAAMRLAKKKERVLLVEATANQVNQFGGYTGMRPLDFRLFVEGLAERCGFPQERLMLGGDHLGPLTWQKSPASEAMRNAENLVEEYVRAGFDKIHLDASMKLGDDDPDARLTDDTMAERGARLCKIAERAHAGSIRAGTPDSAQDGARRGASDGSSDGARDGTPDSALDGSSDGARRGAHAGSSDGSSGGARDGARPGARKFAPVYVMGSEVPTPGGPQHEVDVLEVTSPAACRKSIRTYRETFAQMGLSDAWNRVIAFVVQPGVEFGGDTFFAYDPDKARALCSVLDGEPGLLFEGHSTDYQTEGALRRMVSDGVAILKVGPALTFTLREALMSLEQIERLLLRGTGRPLSDFSACLEHAMLTDESQWASHYRGNGADKLIAIKFSYFDRARYYLHCDEVAKAIDALIANLSGIEIPLPMLSQFMPEQYSKACRSELEPTPRNLIADRIQSLFDGYLRATSGQ